MARAHLESYIKFFGEPQPHRKVCRKDNGQNVEVICLSMNVRQYEVWAFVNNALEGIGEAKVGLSIFKKMWKQKYTNVNVPT